MLIAAASAQAAMTALADPAAPKLLPGPAVSRRTFLRNDTVTVFAEIYDNRSTKQQRQIDTSVTLVSESGQEVFGSRGTVPNPSDTGQWTAHAMVSAMPLTDVAPGRYLLQVERRHSAIRIPSRAKL